MTDSEFWARVRQHREQQQTPANERVLWRLSKGGKIADARIRQVHGRGVELRFSWQGELRSSQIFDTAETLAAAAETKRAELLAVGWVDAPDLLWSR